MSRFCVHFPLLLPPSLRGLKTRKGWLKTVRAENGVTAPRPNPLLVRSHLELLRKLSPFGPQQLAHREARASASMVRPLARTPTTHRRGGGSAAGMAGTNRCGSRRNSARSSSPRQRKSGGRWGPAPVDGAATAAVCARRAEDPCEASSDGSDWSKGLVTGEIRGSGSLCPKHTGDSGTQTGPP